MKKIGIIVQRYGNEVNGGAEFHARILAEQLNKNYQVKVLTTTAIDHNNWENCYPEGESVINNVPIIRFSTQKFNAKKMRKARRAILGEKKYFKILKFLGIFNLIDKYFKIAKTTPKNAHNWLVAQGPYCPDLIDYLKKYQNDYDAFIFFTYLFYPTAIGMPIVSKKSIFIPTAHDEPLLYTKPYENLFSIPKFIMYNTESEKELIESHFKNHTPNADIAGIGIDEYILPDDYQPPVDLDFDFPYFVYIGRIDISKGCDKLVTFFNEFSKSNPTIKLVMIGKKSYDVPKNKNIVLTGFVDEKDKYYLLQKSLGLILPSKYESLSLATLEAMISGVLPIVNKECEVLKRHIEQSQSGFYYDDYESFTAVINKILSLSKTELEEQKTKAKEYVKKDYSWDKILDKFHRAIDFVTDNQENKF